jgi:hypothetical protein
MTKAAATQILAGWLVGDLVRLGIDRVTDQSANGVLDEMRATTPDGTYARTVLTAFGEDVTAWRWRELKRAMRRELRQELDLRRLVNA